MFQQVLYKDIKFDFETVYFKIKLQNTVSKSNFAFFEKDNSAVVIMSGDHFLLQYNGFTKRKTKIKIIIGIHNLHQ